MPLPKKPQPSVNRQPQGVPVGGQFAATTHAEPGVSLSAKKGFFTEEDNDPDIIANAPRFDGDTGDDPTHDFLGEGRGNGNGGQPPRNGGSGGSSDDDERKASQVIVTNAFMQHSSKLENARNIGLTTNSYGKIRVEGVYDAGGNSMDDYSGRLADSLNTEINTHAPGGRAILAEHIIGNRTSATIDAQAAIRGEIKIVSLPPLY